MKNFLHYLEYVLARLAAVFFNCLPVRAATWLARRIGDAAYYLSSGRRNIALRNLELAFGDSVPDKKKRRIARRSLQNLMISVMEFVRAPVTAREANSRFTVVNASQFERAFEAGKGVVAVMAHFGSWEYTAMIPYLLKFKCSVIGKAFRNRYLYDWIQRLRNSTGLVHIDKDESLKVILREVKDNNCVSILIDQWAGNDGKWIEFFGAKTSTTTFPARLAERTGAVIIPVACLRTAPGEYTLQIYDRVPIDANNLDWEIEATKKINSIFEDLIRQYPEQWAWYHRRWR